MISKPDKMNNRDCYTKAIQEGKCPCCKAANDNKNGIVCSRCNTNSKDRYNSLKEKGICIVCRKAEAEDNKFSCGSCRQKAIEKRALSVKFKLCYHCNKPVYGNSKRCVECKKNCKIIDREANQIIKAEVFEAYGGAKCACCFETEESMLELDHINNDGAKDREKYGKGYAFFRNMKKLGYPPGLQVLCANCNRSKQRNGGICAHKTKLDYLLSGITPEMREGYTPKCTS